MSDTALPFYVQQAALNHPRQTAFITEHNRFSYAWYDQAVRTMAGMLHEGGITNNKRVALVGGPLLKQIVAIGALLENGAVAVMVNPKQPPHSLREQMSIAGCNAILADEPLPKMNQSTIFWRQLSLPQDSDQPTGRNRPLSLSRKQPVTIVFTSGSTATIKAALHTYGNHYFSAAGSNENITLQPDDTWLLSLPLFHVSGIGILFRAALSGAAVAIPPSVSDIGDTINRFNPTHVSMVSTQLERLLHSAELTSRAENSFKAILLGGSAFAPGQLQAAYQRRWPVHVSYGSTEMSSQISTTRPGAQLAELRTAGKILKHRQVKIDRQNEILVKGETLFAGYVEDQHLQPSRDKEGWFHTRDTGRFDAAGNLLVTGRLDRMFISGGENIAPEEIERQLENLDGIRKAAVVPVPDATYGYRPVAFIRTSPSAGIDPQHIKQQLHRQMAGFKIPDHFLPWPENQEDTLKTDYKTLQHLAIQQIK
ncbi:MAG: o-succinylbenzoate--CoA ligase [Caldithrix sp.]|nr:o-succinylbenzoate--CoA ligase [Caldithrix sp.]